VDPKLTIFSAAEFAELSLLLDSTLFKGTDKVFLDMVAELAKVFIVIKKKYPTIHKKIMSTNDITTRKSIKNLFDMMVSQITWMMKRKSLTPLLRNELICWFVLFKSFKLFLKDPDNGKYSIVQNR